MKFCKIRPFHYPFLSLQKVGCRANSITDKTSDDTVFTDGQERREKEETEKTLKLITN